MTQTTTNAKLASESYDEKFSRMKERTKTTIDLSTLKVGDTVEFRCGGKAVVSNIAVEDGVGHIFSYFVSFSGSGPKTYKKDGGYAYLYRNENDILDIVAIHPAKVESFKLLGDGK